MQRHAGPRRTFRANTHMYARARARARGFWSQENRFGRFGRFGTSGGRPANGSWCGRRPTVANTSPTFAFGASFGRLATTIPIRQRPALGPHAASAKVARRKTTCQPANGSFPAEILRRGTREQPLSATEFVFVVRTSPGENPCLNRQTVSPTANGTGTKSSFRPHAARRASFGTSSGSL
jgi:hypothetical protein